MSYIYIWVNNSSIFVKNLIIILIIILFKTDYYKNKFILLYKYHLKRDLKERYFKKNIGIYIFIEFIETFILYHYIIIIKKYICLNFIE